MPSDNELAAAAEDVRLAMRSREICFCDEHCGSPPCFCATTLARAALEAAERVRAQERAPMPTVPIIGEAD